MKKNVQLLYKKKMEVTHDNHNLISLII